MNADKHEWTQQVAGCGVAGCGLLVAGCRLLDVRCSRFNAPRSPVLRSSLTAKDGTLHAPRSTSSCLARSLNRFLDDNAADVRRLNDVDARARHYEKPTVPGDGDGFTVLDGDTATVVQFEDERLERRGMKPVPDFIDIHGAGKLTV